MGYVHDLVAIARAAGSATETLAFTLYYYAVTLARTRWDRDAILESMARAVVPD